MPEYSPNSYAVIDRGEAVNLARNWLTDPVRGITDKGIECLARAVMAMDEALRSSGPVELPQEPSHGMLKALAGDPVILAASDEEELRRRYREMVSAWRNGNFESRDATPSKCRGFLPGADPSKCCWCGVRIEDHER